MSERQRCDIGNDQLVASQGNHIVVRLPKHRMTKTEALVHAAWLVALADTDDRFVEVLQAVRNT